MGIKDFKQYPNNQGKDNKEKFLEGRKYHEDKIEGALRYAKKCERFAIICLSSTVLLAGGLIYQSNRAPIVPFGIEFDSTTGLARPIGPIQEGNFNVNEAAIINFIGQYVEQVRTVPLDPVLYRKNRENVYLLMKKTAGLKLEQILINEERDAMFGKQTVLPKIVSVNQATDQTYQVRWTEEIFDITGGRKVIIPMTGLFTITVEKQRDEKLMYKNPFGIYITDFNWSKDQK